MSLEGLVIIGFAFIIYILWRISDKISDIKLQLSEFPDNNLNELGGLIEKIDRLADKVDSTSDLKGGNLIYLSDVKDSLDEINSTLSTLRSTDSEEIKARLDDLIDSVNNLDKSHDL